jgi:replicative DNA helicase
VIDPPRSIQAETAVVGRIMAKGDRAAGEIVGSLRVEDFFDAANRLIFEKIVENYYADEPLDPITVGRQCGKRLANTWGLDEERAIVKVRSLTESLPSGHIRDHAAIVRDEANKRRLLEVAAKIEENVSDGMNPDEAAASASEQAMRIATDSLLDADIIDFGALGRRYYAQAQKERAMVAAGIELGARFGFRFIDRWTKGVRPTELLICGGEPGAGKSSVWWKAAINFAERQARRPPDQKKIGTLVLSLEMGEEPSNSRLAQTLTGISGATLREAKMTDTQMQKIVTEWGRRRDLPLFFNFTSTLRESQLRALVVEAVRRHNVGLVVIDHFKHLHTDFRYRNPVDAEEQKAAYLKTAIAEDLNVAVICLAHTTKGVGDTPDRRPTLTHLRGSYQLAAIADFVCFVYRPIMHATAQEVSSKEVHENDAEMIWRKNRHGFLGEAPFDMNGETMEIKG